jgi:hypothetical protein
LHAPNTFRLFSPLKYPNQIFGKEYIWNKLNDAFNIALPQAEHGLFAAYLDIMNHSPHFLEHETHSTTGFSLAPVSWP